MTVSLLIVLLLALAGLALAVPVLVRLFKPCSLDEITPEWLDQFSPSSYYPMQALLSNDDFRFLARQPGFDLRLYKKLRRERMVIFRQYLRRLISDFNRLHKLARLLVASSTVDQSHLVSRLMLIKLRFTVSVLQAEASYVLCCLGFHVLAARRSIAALEEMSFEVKKLGIPSTAA